MAGDQKRSSSALSQDNHAQRVAACGCVDGFVEEVKKLYNIELKEGARQKSLVALAEIAIAHLGPDQDATGVSTPVANSIEDAETAQRKMFDAKRFESGYNAIQSVKGKDNDSLLKNDYTSLRNAKANALVRWYLYHDTQDKRLDAKIKSLKIWDDRVQRNQLSSQRKQHQACMLEVCQALKALQEAQLQSTEDGPLEFELFLKVKGFFAPQRLGFTLRAMYEAQNINRTLDRIFDGRLEASERASLALPRFASWTSRLKGSEAQQFSATHQKTTNRFYRNAPPVAQRAANESLKTSDNDGSVWANLGLEKVHEHKPEQKKSTVKTVDRGKGHFCALFLDAMDKCEYKIDSEDKRKLLGNAHLAVMATNLYTFLKDRLPEANKRTRAFDTWVASYRSLYCHSHKEKSGELSFYEAVFSVNEDRPFETYQVIDKMVLQVGHPDFQFRYFLTGKYGGLSQYLRDAKHSADASIKAILALASEAIDSTFEIIKAILASGRKVTDPTFARIKAILASGRKVTGPTFAKIKVILASGRKVTDPTLNPFKYDRNAIRPDDDASIENASAIASCMKSLCPNLFGSDDKKSIDVAYFRKKLYPMFALYHVVEAMDDKANRDAWLRADKTGWLVNNNYTDMTSWLGVLTDPTSKKDRIKAFVAAGYEFDAKRDRGALLDALKPKDWEEIFGFYQQNPKAFTNERRQSIKSLFDMWVSNFDQINKTRKDAKGDQKQSYEVQKLQKMTKVLHGFLFATSRKWRFWEGDKRLGTALNDYHSYFDTALDSIVVCSADKQENYVTALKEHFLRVAKPKALVSFLEDDFRTRVMIDEFESPKTKKGLEWHERKQYHDAYQRLLSGIATDTKTEQAQLFAALKPHALAYAVEKKNSKSDDGFISDLSWIADQLCTLHLNKPNSWSKVKLTDFLKMKKISNILNIYVRQSVRSIFNNSQLSSEAWQACVKNFDTMMQKGSRELLKMIGDSMVPNKVRNQKKILDAYWNEAATEDHRAKLQLWQHCDATAQNNFVEKLLQDAKRHDDLALLLPALIGQPKQNHSFLRTICGILFDGENVRKDKYFDLIKIGAGSLASSETNGLRDFHHALYRLQSSSDWATNLKYWAEACRSNSWQSNPDFQQHQRYQGHQQAPEKEGFFYWFFMIHGGLVLLAAIAMTVVVASVSLGPIAFPLVGGLWALGLQCLWVGGLCRQQVNMDTKLRWVRLGCDVTSVMIGIAITLAPAIGAYGLSLHPWLLGIMGIAGTFAMLGIASVLVMIYRRILTEKKTSLLRGGARMLLWAISSSLALWVLLIMMHAMTWSNSLLPVLVLTAIWAVAFIGVTVCSVLSPSEMGVTVVNSQLKTQGPGLVCVLNTQVIPENSSLGGGQAPAQELKNECGR